jgi:dienelactone hydrolase
VRSTILGFAALVLAGTVPAARAQTPTPGAVTTDAVIEAPAVRLSARLYAPVGRERYPVVVLVSGSGNESQLDAPYTRIMARAFAAQGIGALAYDKRGVGASTGTFTGTDFEALGEDAAAVLRYAQSLPQVESAGFWGISQAGWIIPHALRETRGARFAIIVSPAGINPYEQISYFLRTQAPRWGLTAEEAGAAESMHRAIARYYGGRMSHRAASAEIDRHRGARWFNTVVTHPYWDEMPEGRVLAPAQLREALRSRPSDFDIYTVPSSWMNYASVYRSLRSLPTLIIYGGGDELVPPAASRAVFERALRGERRHRHDFVVYDGASHDIDDGEGRTRQDYLDHAARWARTQFDAQR